MRGRLYVASFQNNAIEAASKYGVGLEFNHTCISEALNSENRSALIEAMQADWSKTNFHKAVLHGPFTEIHPAAIDHRARELARKRLDEAYDVCDAMSVNEMIVHTGWIPFVYFKEWQAQKAARFWQDFMSNKPQQFTIFIENVLEDEPYMLADMMKQISDPRIKLCLDIGHANAMTQKEISVEKWIEVLGPYIGHFHLHNNDGTCDSHSDFATGNMDMVSIFDTIHKFCSQSTTFTIEARECEECLIWLHEKNYI